jgi:hypothetical protein
MDIENIYSDDLTFSVKERLPVIAYFCAEIPQLASNKVEESRRHNTAQLWCTPFYKPVSLFFIEINKNI